MLSPVPVAITSIDQKAPAFKGPYFAYRSIPWAVYRSNALSRLFAEPKQVIVPRIYGEIDYRSGKSYWNQGFATETARAMIRYGFENTAWDRIVTAVVPANIASVRLVERLGFVYEKDVNYLEMAGDPNLELDPPIVAYYAFWRDQFTPGNALYRVITPA